MQTTRIIALGLFLISWGPALADEWKKPKLRLATEDGSSAVEYHMAVQFLWQYDYQDQAEGAKRTSESTVKFRRIRTVLKGNVLSEDLTWLMHMSILPNAAELLDAWIDYKIHRWLGVRTGMFKIPFTRHRTNSFTDLMVVDWTYPTWYFGSERQLGVMLHNGMAKPPAFEFQLGIFTGVNSRAANGVGIPRVYGEKLRSPSLFADPAPMENLHSELVLHLAYNHGDFDRKVATDLVGGPPRFSIGASLAWDFDPRPLHDHRLRLAPEVSLRWAGFSLGALFYLGLVDLVASSDDYQPGMLGTLIYASYFFAERYELALRYANVSILKKLRVDARAHADGRIADADQAEVDDLMDKYLRTGRLTAEHEATLGFNVYLYGRTLKWQTDLSLVVHRLEDEDLLDTRLRTQLQLAF